MKGVSLLAFLLYVGLKREFQLLKWRKLLLKGLKCMFQMLILGQRTKTWGKC